MNHFFSYRDEDLHYHHTFTSKPKKSDFFMHTHDVCELYVFFEGKGTFNVEGSEYPLKYGDILIMREYESHYIDIDTECQYRRLAMNFPKKFFENISPDNSLLSPFYEREAGKTNIYHKNEFEPEIYNLLIKNMLNDADDKRLNLVCNLIPLLYEINKIFHSRKNVNEISTVTHQIINYINLNLTTDLRIENISDKFFLSKAQLCRTFKKSTGSTIQNYISVKRLSNAKQLLNEGITPTDVYLLCGYNDYSSFYRAFTKYYGKKPKEEYIKVK